MSCSPPTPAELQHANRFDPVIESTDGTRLYLRRNPPDNTAIAYDIDIVDEAAANRLNFEDRFSTWFDHATLNSVVYGYQQAAAVAGQSIRLSLPETVPERRVTVLPRIDAGSTMPVGAWITTMVIGVPQDSEHVAELQPMTNRGVAVARTHRVEKWSVG